MKRRHFLSTGTSAGVGVLAASISAPAVAQPRELRWRMVSSFPRSLETLHGSAEHLVRRVAELTDNDAWSTLVRLVEGLGMEELAAELAECEDQEELHLAQVRRWYENAIAGQAGLELVESETDITETTPAH